MYTQMRQELLDGKLETSEEDRECLSPFINEADSALNVSFSLRNNSMNLLGKSTRFLGFNRES